MARKSIDSRMDRILEALLPPGSMARREYELPEHLKATLDYHRSRSDQIISRAGNVPGEAYAAFLDGTLHLPRMPYVLHGALGLSDPPWLSGAMGTDEVARLWQTFALGTEQ